MRKRTTLTAALSLVIAAALAGCGSDGGGSDGGGSGSLDGAAITVGTKDFTEDILLGVILAKALESEGADVTSKINVGGTSVAREALTSGEIDVYPEYPGTAWPVHLGHTEVASTDSEQLFEDVATEDLEKNDIKWVGLTPFSDTYGFAANGDLAEKEGGFDFDSMAAYLEANPDAKVCMEIEFPDRPDGLVLWEQATGYEIPESQTQILDAGLIYTQTSDGECDFGEIFTTDGRVQALNLDPVEDPGVMLLYNLSYTFRNDAYEKNAAAYDELADKILTPLTDEKMAELNGKVDVDGEQVEQVAEEYLKDIGIL